eukprot:CCRYP_007716-RD/>CCRYP_007716-RD protein AED:0.35 eAED:0.35 QI:0/0/0/1/0/0/3/0/673
MAPLSFLPYNYHRLRSKQCLFRAKRLHLSVLWWTILVACFADAWLLLPPKRYGHRYAPNLKVPPLPSSLATSALRSIAALQSSVDNNEHDLEIKSAPVLRTPYDPPPRIDDDKKVKDAATSAATSLFVTKVVNGTLPTEDGSPHVLYYEVHHRIPVDALGEGSGLTALVLHGGPGAGCFPRHANFFSPELYEYVVLLDQRGCGKSVPLGEVSMNTLTLLVQDVERLRRHLFGAHGENRPWDCILGGSWGCTLALAYSHSFPSRVRSMVLRGVCLFRRKEIDWLFGDPPLKQRNDYLLSTSNLRELVGVTRNTPTKTYSSPKNDKDSTATASQLFSQAWKAFSEGVGVSTKSQEQMTTQRNRSVLIQYYHRLLGSNSLIRARAAQSWFRWEMGIYSSGLPKETQSKTNGNKTELLIWNPARQTWHYEDAKVLNNRSVTSIDNSYTVDGDQSNLHRSVDESVVQSLRQYSRPPTEQTLETERSTGQVQPMRVENIALDEASAQPIESNTNSKNQSLTSNSTFDSTTFIPAQAMLTCYYCINDDHVLHPYRSFLSLSSKTASWYASHIPPLSTMKSSQPMPSSTDQSYPLPPCIAIQGGLDAICPPDTALDLHHSWKELELRIALSSGHSMYDPVIAGEIVKALDRFGQALLKEQNEEVRLVGENVPSVAMAVCLQ